MVTFKLMIVVIARFRTYFCFPDPQSADVPQLRVEVLHGLRQRDEGEPQAGPSTRRSPTSDAVSYVFIILFRLCYYTNYSL